MSASRRWQREGLDWPNREASRFVNAGGIQWHVQDMGSGPSILLLHGTGAATHSWAGLAPLLAKDFRVIAPDLPGHGFTELVPAEGASLPGMAAALDALLEELKVAPELVVGHSAGAAILAYLSLEGAIRPRAIISLNGAFLPFGRVAAPLFSGAAKMLASSSVVPYMVALQGFRRSSVDRLIRQTGSTLGDKYVDYYRTLVRTPHHVAGTLRMMANWDLEALERNLPRLEPPLYLLVCANDQAVAPAQARRLARRIPGARLQELPGLGHLGHEENPALFAQLIRDIAVEQGLLRPAAD